MRRFIKDTKGAVTVFITLLLIPAILVSGTAVDLARMHTARSIVQDANQLAANSVLTQYNALLKDLYGLFGVAEDDPILGRLLDDYIEVSIFGDSGHDRSFGTLQIFYGSNVSLEELAFADGKDLRNEDVLRRQIEEYMKFRGPVVIVQDILEALGSNGSNTYKEDTGVIEDKLEIENAIAELYEKYKELYDAIVDADRCTQVVGGIAGVTAAPVSRNLTEIRDEFASLRACYEAWEKAVEDEDEDAIKDHAARYNAILVNIRSRTIGGPTGSNWSNGGWQNRGNPQGLNVTVERAIIRADDQKPKHDTVVEISRQIDSMNAELRQKVEDFENRVMSGDCNPELKEALTQRTGSPPKSIIERYKDILKWDNLEGLANTYKDNGYSYIDDILKPMLEDAMYRNKDNLSGASLTREQLENITTNSSFNLSSSTPVDRSLAATFARFTRDNVTYNMPPGFLRFAENTADHKAFFDELEQMMNQPDIPPVKLYDGQEEASGSNAEEKQRGMISELLNIVNEAYAGLANSPLGAMYVRNETSSDSESMDMQEIVDIIPQSKNDPVSTVLSDPMSSITSAADYLLLLTYCTSMFSNYTTARPETIGKSRDELSGINFPKTVAGIPLSPEVNYFFQSEWEYLYHGKNNASSNLSAVTRLIFLVRLICNYITVFSVSEVNTVINGIRTAFAWNPPLSLILSELARAAFVAAESTIDVANLRSGRRVPLIKSAKSGEWVCSPRGIVNALGNVASDAAGNSNQSKNDKGLTYSNYMMFFFIAQGLFGSDAGTELTKRTADLIEWNVINYENRIFSDESKMTEALSDEGRFKLIDMKTDFSLTTTVDMRMLFLSMVFAQNFSDSRGIGMPTTVPVIVTDHRGY